MAVQSGYNSSHATIPMCIGPPYHLLLCLHFSFIISDPPLFRSYLFSSQRNFKQKKRNPQINITRNNPFYPFTHTPLTHARRAIQSIHSYSHFLSWYHHHNNILTLIIHKLNKAERCPIDASSLDVRYQDTNLKILR